MMENIRVGTISDRDVSLNDIALKLLGNEFYTINGDYEDDLKYLVEDNLKSKENDEQINGNEIQNLQKWLGLPDVLDENWSKVVSEENDEDKVAANSNQDVSSLGVVEDDNINMGAIDANIDTETVSTINKNAKNEDDDNKRKSVSRTSSEEMINVIDENNIDNDSTKHKLSHEQSKEFFKLLEHNMNTQMADESLLYDYDEYESYEDDNHLKKPEETLKNSKDKIVDFDNQYDRIDLIIRDAQNEYQKMRKQSVLAKNKFIEDNKTIINFKSLKPDEVLRKFYFQEKCNLLQQNTAFIQFIKLLKNNDDVDEKLFDEFFKDMLSAKQKGFINSKIL